MIPSVKAEERFRVYYEHISGISKDKIIFYIKEDHSVQAAVECAISETAEIIKELTEYGRESDELQNMDRILAWYDKILIELKKMK